MSIGITGAAGQLGRLVTARLLESIDPAELVLTTRNPDALADAAARGIAVRAADFAAPDGLAAAFAGVDRLLLISTDVIGERLAGHRAAIAAAVAAGVRHVVYTSVPEPVPANPALAVPDHAATEEALRASGLHWTTLRNNLYADMQVAGLQHAAATGQLVTNTGTGAAAYATRADCAGAAAGALLSAGDTDRTLDVTGPAALTAADLAQLAAGLGDRPVTVVDVDDEAYAAGLLAAGLPEPVAAVITSFGAATRGGYLATVTDAVAALSGAPATPLADLLGRG